MCASSDASPRPLTPRGRRVASEPPSLRRRPTVDAPVRRAPGAVHAPLARTLTLALSSPAALGRPAGAAASPPSPTKRPPSSCASSSRSAPYLEQALGMPVKFTPVTDYAATVEGLAAGKLDLVWYGGFTFVQARKRTGNAIPLVQREEDARFHSKFIVPAASKAQKLGT